MNIRQRRQLWSARDWAREEGLTVPVVVTRAVWEVLEPSDALAADGEDLRDRVVELLTSLRAALVAAPGAAEIRFAPRLALAPGEDPEPIEMVARLEAKGGRPTSVIVAILE